MEPKMRCTSLQRPLTKEAAASVLSVSKRTIENWVANGTMPRPYGIGRRVYWHPETFYRWLNERLGRSANAEEATATSAPVTDPNAKGSPTSPEIEGHKRGRPRKQLSQRLAFALRHHSTARDDEKGPTRARLQNSGQAETGGAARRTRTPDKPS